MKKVPIVLSAVVLASSSVGMTLPTALNLERQGEIRETILTNDPLSGTNLGIVARDGQLGDISLKENDVSSNFQLLSVDYKQNQMGIQIFEREDWRIKRVVVAYRNYEGGITEVESDANLTKLGVANDSEWKVVWDYGDTRGIVDLYQYVAPEEDGISVKIEENLTDILYYAVEYGHRAADGEGWQDEWWMRGKINYRNCAHSSVFDKETMICMWEGDGSYGVRTANYDIVEMPAETVISWDEEWNKVQRQRYMAAQERLMGLKDDLYNMLRILDGVDETLSGLEVTLPKSENMSNLEGLKAGNAQLQLLSKELREKYLGLGNTANQAELEKLRQEKVELLNEKTVLIEEKARIAQENAELKAQIEELERGNEGLGENVTDTETTEVISGVDSGVAVEATEMTEMTRELVATTETRIVTVERETETGVDMSEKVKDDARGSGDQEAETVVPNLGDLERETKMSWQWVVIVGLGVLAMMGLGVQRLWQNKRK